MTSAKTIHYVINSNKWFSAVTDYSLRLAEFLHAQPDCRVVVCAHPQSPLKAKCDVLGIEFCEIPLLPSGVLNFFRAWIRIFNLLREKSNSQGIVWTFEGREHTLCALSKVIHRRMWITLQLIRVRGQAAAVRNSWLNRILYAQLTERVVFAASVVKQRVPFALPLGQARVQLYCRDSHISEAKRPTVFDSQKSVAALESLNGQPLLDFSLPLFLVVGRFDPVKAHSLLLKAFAHARFAGSLPCQLVFVGESQNIQAVELFEEARTLLGQGTVLVPHKLYAVSSPLNTHGNPQGGKTQGGNKRVFIYDGRMPELASLMAHAHFGVVPSLASEVICRVAVEFLQAGTPLIVSDAGALPEVLAQSPARVCPAGNLESLVEALEWAHKLVSLEPEAHSAMRKQCQTIGRERYGSQNYRALLDWALKS